MTLVFILLLLLAIWAAVSLGGVRKAPEPGRPKGGTRKEARSRRRNRGEPLIMPTDHGDSPADDDSRDDRFEGGGGRFGGGGASGSWGDGLDHDGDDGDD